MEMKEQLHILKNIIMIGSFAYWIIAGMERMSPQTSTNGTRHIKIAHPTQPTKL